MNSHIILLFGFFVSSSICAQNHKYNLTQTIRGVVYDIETEQPLPGVNVLLLDTEPLQGASTNAEGAFVIEEVPIGRHNVQFTFIGYEPLVLKQMMLSSGKELVLSIKMNASFAKLDEVVLRATKNKNEALNEMATVSARSFSVEETQRYAAAIFDPARMAQNFAGVNSSGDDLMNEIVVRGNSPKGILWRLEGIEIPNPNHFDDIGATGGAISMLSSSTLSQSDFYTGAFPAEFGNALSGVFDLRLRPGNNKEHEYAVMLGISGVEMSAEGPFSEHSKASYLVNYRYSTTALLKPFLEEAIGAAVPAYQDMSFKVNIPTQKIGLIQFFGLGGYNDYASSLEPDATLWPNEGSSSWSFESNQYKGVLGMSHRIYLKNNSYLKTVLSLSADNYEAQSFNIDNSYYINSDNYLKVKTEDTQTENYTFRVNSFFHSQLNAQHTLRLGLSSNKLNYTATSKVDNAEGNDPFTLFNSDGNTILFQSYAQWKYRISELWTLHTGFHYSHLNLNNSQVLEPRMSLAWQCHPLHKLSLSFGRHSKPEHLSTYLIRDEESLLQENKNLGFSKAEHLVLAYDLSVNEHMRLKTEIYHQKLFNVPVENEISSSFSVLNMRSIYDLFGTRGLVNEGTGRNYGIDITLERSFAEGHYYLLTGSLFESKYMALNKVEYNSRYNSNFLITALAGKEWRVGSHKMNILGLNTKFKYGGGNRNTAIDVAASIQEGETVFEEEPYATRHKDYFRMDFGFSYKINKGKSTHTLLMDIQNLSNQQNIGGQFYNEDTQEIEYWYQTGMLPVFNYRIEF